MKLKEVFAKNLKHYREAKGWTMETLANRAGLSKGAIHKYESGKEGFQIEGLERCAKALGVKETDLVRTDDLPAVPEREITVRDAIRTLVRFVDTTEHLEVVPPQVAKLIPNVRDWETVETLLKAIAQSKK